MRDESSLTLVVKQDCNTLYQVERSTYHPHVVYFADGVRSQPQRNQCYYVELQESIDYNSRFWYVLKYLLYHLHFIFLILINYIY